MNRSPRGFDADNIREYYFRRGCSGDIMFQSIRVFDILATNGFYVYMKQGGNIYHRKDGIWQ